MIKIVCKAFIMVQIGLTRAGPGPARSGYIVVMNDAMTAIEGYDASVATIDAAQNVKKTFPNSTNIKHIYNSSIFGFSADMTQEAVDQLSLDPHVQHIEEDGELRSNELWNLDRIDQRELPLDGVYENYDERAGSGSYIYVMDTGVRVDHEEFRMRSGGSRVVTGKDFVRDGKGWGDCNGHGTHCASTAAGNSCGVAKMASIISVRVLGCRGAGSFSDMIAAIDWVIQDSKKRAPGRGVISMSLGGGRSEAINRAVNSAAEQGIPVIVAAGNDNADACSYSPSSASGAVVVASSTNADRRSSFSNYGNCVDIIAPGSSILGADFKSRTNKVIMSGTSMACPHVAGVVALGSAIHQSEVISNLMRTATPNVIMQDEHPLVYTGLPVFPTRRPTEITWPFPTQIPTNLPRLRPSPSPDAGMCKTSSGEKCVFPFKFNNRIFYSCTNDYDPGNLAWCSTGVDENSEHVPGRWGHCSSTPQCMLPMCSGDGDVDARAVERDRRGIQPDRGNPVTVIVDSADDSREIAISALVIACLQCALMVWWVACECGISESIKFRSCNFTKGTPPSTPRAVCVQASL